jgi:hypothetical protein
VAVLLDMAILPGATRGDSLACLAVGASQADD